MYLSKVLRSLGFQNIATTPIDKFENTVKSFSFKHVFIVCNLGNELITRIYRLHT